MDVKDSLDDMDVAEQIAHLHNHGLSDLEIWERLGIEPDELVRLALNLMTAYGPGPVSA